MSIAAAPVSAVVRVAAAILESVAVRGGDNFAKGVLRMYDADIVPEAPLADYLSRWVQHTDTGVAEIVSAMAYIDRLCSRAGLCLTRRNIHRVLLAALHAATKFHEDSAPFVMSHYAAVGGVSHAELARLECRFLADVEWQLHVDAAVAEKYLSVFRRNPAWSQAAPVTPRRCPSPAPVEESFSSNGASSECVTCASSPSAHTTPQPPATKGSKAREWAMRFIARHQ